MTQTKDKQLLFLICILLAAATAAVYLQVLRFDFINYDDAGYITENPHILLGLTADGLRWAFTTFHASNWHPLTWLSLMLDSQLFGANPGAFHLTNLLLHTVNTLLLFIVLHRLTTRIWLSAFVAALFALHPLHVESVAWTVERKDVLSTLFWFLTTLAYIRYIQQPTTKRYLTILIAFAIGLMTKPMLVTLPLILLLLDYWPLERFQSSTTTSGKPISDLIREKYPLFALSAISCVITVFAQRSGGALSALQVFSLKARVTNAVVSYVSYIAKTFYPAKLAIFYPHPQNNLPLWQIALSIVILLAISTCVISMSRQRKYLLAGWLWYLGTLVPVIGIVQVGAQAMADRYTYIPLIGLFIVIAWAAGDLLIQWRHRNIILSITASLVCIILMTLTYKQVGYWRNSITIFNHALDVTSNNYVAHNNLGIALGENGDLDGAIKQFEATLKIRPKDTDAHFNIAEALFKKGKSDEAVARYNKVLDLNPSDHDVYEALGMIKFEKGKFEEAIDLFQKGLSRNPNTASLHNCLGLVLLRIGSTDEAIGELETAAKLGGDSMTYTNLGLAIASKGDYDTALKYYRRAIRLEPKNAEAHYNLGNLFLTQAKTAKAILEYKQAVRINPSYTKAYGNLAITLAQQGRLDEAIENFSRVVELEPNSSDAHFNLAYALLDIGKLSEAAAHFKKVLSLEPNNAATHCSLGEILFQQGKIEDAIAEFNYVLKINPENPQARKGLDKALASQKKPK